MTRAVAIFVLIADKAVNAFSAMHVLRPDVSAFVQPWISALDGMKELYPQASRMAWEAS
jgi:hypothetical protein